MKGLAVLFLCTVACSRPSPAPESAHAPVAPPAPFDSLVLTLPDSTEVHLVKGREGIAADGTTCEERSVVLIKGARRVMVPLLYTRTAPRLERGRLLATLSNRCIDVTEYVVDPATAYPTPRSEAR